MITCFDTLIESLSIHYIGNASKNEPCIFSNEPLSLQDEQLAPLALEFFIKPFEKLQESFQFFHTGDLRLNEVYHYSREIFSGNMNPHEASIGIAKHLYQISSHPNIKPGELYIARLKNILVHGIEREAIGIFKSEIKEPYLKIENDGSSFDLRYELNGINIKKLDKGCLIFNTEEENGYQVMVIDGTNKNSEALYWVDAFLQLKVRNDEFTQTSNLLTVYKNFIAEGVDESIELTRPEKIDLLNRSINYFKEKEQFNLNEFSNEVIGHEHGVKLFMQYKSDYEQRYQTDIADEFSISSTAVKKQARVYKSVLKLDRNFHIYIHGSSELIEKGVDENGRKFYKIYYQEES
jgi:hypothetical protein